MIFRHLVLENLFSYQKAEFDFSGESKEKNVVLIFGRNGYGKTSLINSIKLLFAGPNDEIRSSVLPGSRLSHEQYVLGVSDEWMGIFNAKARRNGQKICRVFLRWEENEIPIEVERRWIISEKGYKEELELDVLGDSPRHLTNEAAQQFLNERLPEDYLPFFFFDGEQIQRLAEANRSQTTREIERLLQLSPIDTLIEYIDKATRTWRNQDMPAAVKLMLTRLEKEHAELEARTAETLERQETLQLERSDLERVIRQEDIYLESRRTGQLLAEEGPLKAELVKRNEELESIQLRIADTLPANGFLLANIPLVSAGLREVNKVLDNPTGAQVDALKDVLEGLPVDLFKPPCPTPGLTESQVRFYRERLGLLLKAYIPTPESISDGLFKFDSVAAKPLRALFEHILQSGHERDDRIGQLKDAVRLKNEIRRIEDKLNDISLLSPDEQREYVERKARNGERHVRLGAIGKDLEAIDSLLTELSRQIENKGGEIRSQEKKVAVSEKNRKKLNRAETLKRFFRDYKAELKKRKRAAIEEAVNHRFKELMTSHGLISSIRIDDMFGVHYLDSEENSVGLASVSAGMKQLAATALLWALKDISGKDLPIVIDTPLARIDRGHQENLLTRYYPSVGRQVIILPTDSEIDKEKYSWIEPHVYREYRLENTNGQDTHVLGPVASSVEASNV